VRAEQHDKFPRANNSRRDDRSAVGEFLAGDGAIRAPNSSAMRRVSSSIRCHQHDFPIEITSLRASAAKTARKPLGFVRQRMTTESLGVEGVAHFCGEPARCCARRGVIDVMQPFLHVRLKLAERLRKRPET